MVIAAAGVRNKGAEFDHPLVVGGRMASRNAVGGFGRGGLNPAISVLAGALHGGSASGSRGEQGWESVVAERVAARTVIVSAGGGESRVRGGSGRPRDRSPSDVR